MNKNILRLALLLLIFAFTFCSTSDESPKLNSFSINGTVKEMNTGEYKIQSGQVYLSMGVLEKHFELSFKDIVPGRQIGICRDDLCIPFMVQKGNQDAAFKDGNEYFIPATALLEKLGGEAIWDEATLKLDIKLATELSDFNQN